MSQDGRALRAALNWIEQIVAGGLNIHFGQAEQVTVKALDLGDNDSALGRFIQREKPTPDELAIVMLALAPELDPALFNRLLSAHLPDGGDFPQFGGAKGGNCRGILPTGETAQFVLAGPILGRRLFIRQLFGADHWFNRKGVLHVEPVREGEPAMSGRLVLDPEIVEEIVTGKVGRPAFSMDFPAEYIETTMGWDDLVLNPTTLRHIVEIEYWITHNDTLLKDWGMGRKINPGYRALFYGPPGTGKTLTATLLGKQTGKDVFRVDLSRVVSKYIGETEKNLSRLFDKAENKDWILFFDEADALFGKRTDIRDAHDKYANQEVAYLLQRIESYAGLVILASNQRANIDDAFVRRLQAIIAFPMPRAEERLAIWRKSIPSQLELAPDADLHFIAERHELTGANILNVTHYCAIDALARKTRRLDLMGLEAAIQREYVKEGKIM